MHGPLYIVWNAQQDINVPILDEQHHAVVAAINSLHFFISQGWGVAALNPTLKVIRTCAGFHAKTEEGILEQSGAGVLMVANHQQRHRSFDQNVTSATSEAIAEQDPQILLKFLRNWWVQHLTKDHAEYTACLSRLTMHP